MEEATHATPKLLQASAALVALALRVDAQETFAKEKMLIEKLGLAKRGKSLSGRVSSLVCYDLYSY